MYLIKLSATRSTNTYLKELQSVQNCEDFTTVWTGMQTKGKGQRGNVWYSEPFKNLTFSVLKINLSIELKDQFVLNCLVSLSVYQVLKNCLLPRLYIKWPNDILADNLKISGILNEPVIKKGVISSAILGIGINVNQTDFNVLNKASSIKLLTGNMLELEPLLDKVVNQLKLNFETLENKGVPYFYKAFEEVMFRKNKPSTFLTAEGNKFVGIILGITQEGFLRVKLEDDDVQSFDLKQIQLLY